MKKVDLENYKAVIKTVIELDSYNLGELIQDTYGGSFEFEAIEEANRGHYEFKMLKLGKVSEYHEKDHAKIREGKYPMYCTRRVLHCLIEDGVIPNAIYMVDNNY